MHRMLWAFYLLNPFRFVVGTGGSIALAFRFWCGWCTCHFGYIFIRDLASTIEIYYHWHCFYWLSYRRIFRRAYELYCFGLEASISDWVHTVYHFHFFHLAIERIRSMESVKKIFVAWKGKIYR